jgi:hypothetical protein
VKVEAFGEPIILSGDIEKLPPDFLACEVLSIEANPLRFRAKLLGLQ